MSRPTAEYRLEEPRGPVGWCCVSLDGRWLAAGGDDGWLAVWEAEGGALVGVGKTATTPWERAAAFGLPGGGEPLLAPGRFGGLSSWRFQTGLVEQFPISTHPGGGHALACVFAEHGDAELLIATDIREVRFLYPFSGGMYPDYGFYRQSECRSFLVGLGGGVGGAGDRGAVTCAGLAADASAVAFGESNGCVTVFDLRAEPVPLATRLPGPRSPDARAFTPPMPVRSLATGEGGSLTAAIDDGGVTLLRPPDRTEALPLASGVDPTCCALYPGGERLAVGTADGRVVVGTTPCEPALRERR